MTDDYIDLKSQQNGDEQSQETEEVTSWWIGRWSHVIAGGVFCILYFPLSDHVWSWQVAVTLSYIVFMLCCACGLSFQDSDDLSDEIAQYMGILLVRQFFVLALISFCAFGWRHLIPFLPSWATARGIRNLSLWEVGGIIAVYVVALREATWMARKIKQRFPEIKEPLDSISSDGSI